jgi:Methyltransferase domain
MDRRTRILAGLNVGHSVGVEIGALDKPLVTREMGEILYVDHADTATLRKKYQEDPGVRADAIVDVDGVWGTNTLLEAIGGRKVDYVLASHVIEHVPDLITWLNELESILAPGGQIRFVIPDMRYTFDCLRRETVFSDVLPAYIARARRPMPREVIDFICNAADVRSDLLWHKPARQAVTRKLYHFADAAQLGEASMRGEYHDVHCWTFTPASFARLMSEIGAAGLSNLACRAFTDTPIGGMEFYVSLAVLATADALPWAQMERAARPNPSSGLLRPFFTSLHPRVLKPKLERFGRRYCPSLLERARQALRA